MTTKDIEKLGFTKKQAQVYLAVLELGSASADRIARYIKLPKSSTYDTLSSLMATGAVHAFLQKSRKRFVASDPTLLVEDIQKRAKEVEAILPELRAFFTGGTTKPRIRYLEGKAGVKIVLNEILKEAKELIGIGSPEKIFPKLSEYFPNFARERVARKIPIKLIMKDSPFARERKEAGKKELRQVTLLDIPAPFMSLIYVWNSKTAIFNLGSDLIAVIIESKDLAQTLTMLFNALWKE